MTTATLNRQELEDLKASVDLVALFEATGAPLKPVGKNWFCRCPFHNDDEASLCVNPKDRLWNCFGCGAAGDGLTWLQLREKLNFPQSIARLREFAGTPEPTPAVPKPAPELDRNGLLTRVMERYFQRFKECPEAQQYLTDRGLASRELWETFRVGYADGTLLNSLPSAGPVREQLTQLGILNAEGKEHFRGCVVVPLDHPDDGLVGFYGRRLDPSGAVQHLYLPGPKRGVLQWQALKRGKRVFIAESVLDALSLWQAGVKDVTCLYGAGHMHKDLEKLLGSLATHEVVFCLDGDEAGEKATQRFAERLAERGIVCMWTPLPGGQDPNEILLERGPDGLRELVGRPRPLLTPAAMPEEKPQTTATTEGFSFKVGDVLYQATMVPPFVGRLRVLLVAARENNLYSEKFDLHSQRARALTAGQLVRSLELTRAEAERHLTLLLKEALAWVDSQKLEDSSTRKKAPVLKQEEKNEAITFLKRPNLVAAILADMEALGYVGEEKSKLLAYLIGLSRKLPRPLSGIVISQSGAGKSTLTELVELLAPPEDVLLYSRFTPQALFYMSHDLKGLILILEERAGGEAADYSIRTLQSRQKLNLLAPVKDPVTGKMTTQSYEVEGPVAYLETTTNPYLNPENASRCFELYMDESEEQTQRIQTQQKTRRLPTKVDNEELVESILTRHHNAQRMLEPLKVFIPYADKIEFPSQWLRTRRDNERFLCLIEAIAFLHQYQRERGELDNGKPYVLANLQDYRLAYDLAQEVLVSTFHELTREARSLWELIVPYVKATDPERPKEVVFTLKDLRAITNYPNHRLRRSMQELVEMEYALQSQTPNGLPAEYSLTSLELQQGKLPGLTTPDEMEKLWP